MPRDADVARFADDTLRLIRHARGDAGAVSAARLALAVSGGPDSMALLALAAAAFPDRVSAATFDHRLRRDSAEEAQMVAVACAGLGLPHAILTPSAPIAGASIQARAREARYAALLDWAEHGERGFLLTAHHADDQAETLLMRLNRASGLAGLTGIRPMRVAGRVVILRPLLGWRRAGLRAIVEASGLPFVDDPSNDDARHDRTRIRALLAATPALDPAALAASARFIGEAEEVVAGQAETLWAERWHGPGRPFALDDLPRELRRRLIRRAAHASRRALGIVLPPLAEAANVEALLDAMEQRRTATLGGLVVVRDGTGWTFRAAPPRRPH